MRAFALSAAILAGMPGVAGAQIEIHAHRGGPLATVDGQVVPVAPENSLRAFEHAHANGYVVELDVKPARDGVPVVIHDSTLDRTTNCSGLVSDFTAAELSRCRLDVIGTAGVTAPNTEPDRIPRLDETLEWAKSSGARLSVEIKRANTARPPAFAATVVASLDASGVEREQVLVQSFWPPDLDLARSSGWRTLLLAPKERSRGAPALASARGYDVLSVEGPLRAGFMEAVRLHDLLSAKWPLRGDFLETAGGRPVLAWTLNHPAEIAGALADGVDGIVSDNPGLVRGLVAAG